MRNSRISPVQFCFLGPFELRVEGKGEATLPAKKSQALLCFLSMRPDQPVSREKLAGLLWTDSASEFARTNLRQSVTVIRKTLNNSEFPCLINDGSALSLDSNFADSDIRQFDHCQLDDPLEALENAISIYRGELLEGVNLDNSSIADWLTRERQRLHDKMTLICHQLLKRYREMGSTEKEFDTANRLLTFDTLDEVAHRSIMFCHNETGQRHLALRQYESCQKLLRSELDTTPEVATSNLYQEILNRGRSTELDTSNKSAALPIETIVKPENTPLSSRLNGNPPNYKLIVLSAAGLLLVVSILIGTIKNASEKPPTELSISDTLEAFDLHPKGDKPTIAVLPFTNRSGNDDQTYFSDGLTEDLITDLSKIEGLIVIARSSSFAYRNATPDIQKIESELGATAILHGSIRKVENKIRINVHLINAQDGTQLWAERYDRNLSDVLQLQDLISRSIVAELSIQLTDSDQERLERVMAVNPDAYDLFLKSLRPIRELTEGGRAEAREILHRVIEIDGSFARAWANLALTYVQDVTFDFTTDKEKSINKALEYATRALELNETAPQVHFALAGINLAKRSYSEAIENAKRSIQLDPNYADGYGTLAQTLMFSGELESALASMNVAKRLNPRYTFTYLWVEGQIHFLAGRFEKAIEIFEDINTRNPSFVSSRKLLISAYGQIGNLEEAEWEIAELFTLNPDFSVQNEKTVVLYKEASHRTLFIEGLIKAGL